MANNAYDSGNIMRLISPPHARQIRALPHLAGGAYSNLDIDGTIDFMTRRYVTPMAQRYDLSEVTLADGAAGYGCLSIAFLLRGGRGAPGNFGVPGKAVIASGAGNLLFLRAVRGKLSAVVLRGFLPGEQPALFQQFLVKLPPQGIAQKETGVGGITDAEASDGFLLQPAADQIGARIRALGALQIFLEERTGALVDFEQRGP